MSEPVKPKPSSLELLERAGAGNAPQIERMPTPDIRQMLPVRDGVRLDTYVWLPKDIAKAPAILLRTPYREDVLGWARLGQMSWVEAGYALVYQMIRGQGVSEGVFSFNAPHERTDGYDTVEWIAAQAWCDGAVGMDGGSYVGMTAMAAAAERPPHLKCAVVSVPCTDFFREIPYFGGGFSRLHTLNWCNLIQINSLSELTGGFMSTMPILSKPEWMRRLTVRPVKDAADDLLRGDKLAHYRDALAHPTFDDWWQARTLNERDYAAMDVPMLVMNGVFDFGAGAHALWRGLVEQVGPRDDQQMIIGPWDHGQVGVGGGTRFGPFELGDAALGDPNELRLAFFDKHLRNRGEGPDIGGRVKVFIVGRNRYESFDAYPPREAKPRALYLGGAGDANTWRGDGKLTAEPGADAADEMLSDPALPYMPAMTTALNAPLDLRDQVRHSETLVYKTEPFETPVTLIGEPAAVLHVSVDAPDADVVVQLCEIRPDGMIAMLSQGALRLRYRNGYDAEVLMTPGEPAEVRVPLLHLNYQLAAGSRLGVLVQPDLFPLIDPNPNTGEPIATAVTLRPATVTVLHGAAHPSRIEFLELPQAPPATA